MTIQSQPCPICLERSGLTDEDIIPTWLRKEIRRVQPLGPETPRRLKIRICRRCNEQMGRDIEAPASSILKAMMSGATVVLDKAAQTLVARWVAKTSFLGLLRRDNDIEVLQTHAARQLRSIMQSAGLELSASVRLFDVSLAPWDPTIVPAIRRIIPCGVTPPVGTYSVTYVQQLGYEFITSTPQVIDDYARATHNHARSVSVYPIVQPQVAWPPRQTTLQKDMDHLREAYGGLRDDGLAGPSSYTWLGQSTD